MRLLPENEMVRMQQRRQNDTATKDIWEECSKGVLSVTCRWGLLPEPLKCSGARESCQQI